MLEVFAITTSLDIDSAIIILEIICIPVFIVSPFITIFQYYEYIKYVLILMKIGKTCILLVFSRQLLTVNIMILRKVTFQSFGQD